MCRDVSFEPIGTIVERLLEGLAVDTGRTASTASAQTGRETGRALHVGPREQTNVVQFGKRGAHRSAPQSQEDQKQTVTVRETITRRNTPLASRR